MEDTISELGKNLDAIGEKMVTAEHNFTHATLTSLDINHSSRSVFSSVFVSLANQRALNVLWSAYFLPTDWYVCLFSALRMNSAR